MAIRDDLHSELVSVVIPAYNCEPTLAATLASVRAQTHRALEIIVVDDGSRDGTVALVEREAAADPRIRLLRQANAGVAAARNAGIAEARGAFVAPVDADDLWRPRALERLLRALAAGGPPAALAYGWSCIVDEAGRISAPGDRPHYSGDVLPGLFYGNFVGNGSCALMRREAVLAAGGYDPSLRARQAQGCEDWKLYLALAGEHHFALVADVLVGYRRLTGAMSSDNAQMLRSDAIVRDELRARYPDNRAEIDLGRRYYLLWLVEREIAEGRWDRCAALLEELDRTGGGEGLRGLAQRGRLRARYALRRLRGGSGQGGGRPPFLAEPAAQGIAA